ncbi:MAG: hypothetical protein JO076_11215 [Verrucomicrobia bacterium]|nr:hypothetical protein [Verrucomicrobiota bacterium]
MRRFLSLVVILWCLTQAGWALSISETWNSANQAYQSGKYEQAKVDYIQLLENQYYCPELFYNLGNTWFKLGETGRAILNYQRALILKPGLEEARFNLRTLLQIAGSDETPSFRERLSPYADGFALVASVTFWLAVFFVCFGVVRRTGKRNWWRVGALISALCAITFLALTFWMGQGLRDPEWALVVESPADLKYGPANTARTIGSLHLGELIRTVSIKGDWTFCRDESGALGWLLTRKMERLVP